MTVGETVAVTCSFGSKKMRYEWARWHVRTALFDLESVINDSNHISVQNYCYAVLSYFHLGIGPDDSCQISAVQFFIKA